MVVKQDLGRDLNRNPKHVHEHWTRALEHVLTRYEKGTLNVDQKQHIIDHMVTNRLSTTTDVNWKELSSLPEFEGTTQHYLERTY